MHLRPGAVDLVEEEDRQVFAVLHQRARVHRGAAIGADVRVVHQIAGHQVDGAFDARIGAAEHLRESTQQRRLAHAHVALQQHMASREQGRVDEPDGPLLANDGAGHLGLQRQGARAGVGQQRVDSFHASVSIRHLAWRRGQQPRRTYGGGHGPGPPRPPRAQLHNLSCHRRRRGGRVVLTVVVRGF